MEDAFIKSWPTIVGGIIACAGGLLVSWWSNRLARKRESENRIGEFKGLLGRWKGRTMYSTADQLSTIYLDFSDAMWGYCARFRNDFKDPEMVEALCEDLDRVAREANADDSKKKEMAEKISALLKSF